MRATHTLSFPASGCVEGLGVLLLWIRVTGSDLLLDFSHLSLVLFWMNAVLEQTSPCAAFFQNKIPFPFSPSVYSFCCLLQQASSVPRFLFRSYYFSHRLFIYSFPPHLCPTIFPFTVPLRHLRFYFFGSNYIF